MRVKEEKSFLWIKTQIPQRPSEGASGRPGRMEHSPSVPGPVCDGVCEGSRVYLRQGHQEAKGPECWKREYPCVR